jgi:hypothetical protein
MAVRGIDSFKLTREEMRGMEAAEMSFLRSSSKQTINVKMIVLLEKEGDNRN